MEKVRLIAIILAALIRFSLLVSCGRDIVKTKETTTNGNAYVGMSYQVV